jgi:predicted SprT family Zn-dependent metalloprotease
VPKRSSPPPSSPWAPAGEYTVRLTVGGQSYMQPLTLRLDPRVTTSASNLAQNNKLSLEMYELARNARMTYGQAHDLGQEVAKLGSTQRDTSDSFKAKIDAVAPDEVRGSREFGRGYQVATTLNGVSNAALTALMSLQSADTAPTAAQTAATERAKTQAQAVMAKWNQVKTTDLAAFNARLRSKGQAALTLPPLRMPATLPSDENGNVKENEE